MKFLLPVAVMALAAFFAPAKAQQVVMGTLQMICLPQTIDALSDQFRESHGEVPIGRGIVFGEEGVFYLLLNKKTASWTIVAYDLNREMTCVVSNGDDWEILPPLKNPAPHKKPVPQTQGTDL
jgi:hypothetical protein